MRYFYRDLSTGMSSHHTLLGSQKKKNTINTIPITSCHTRQPSTKETLRVWHHGAIFAAHSAAGTRHPRCILEKKTLILFWSRTAALTSSIPIIHLLKLEDVFSDANGVIVCSCLSPNLCHGTCRCQPNHKNHLSSPLFLEALMMLCNNKDK